MSYIQPTNHIQFILKSETAITKEALRSLDATNGGIETYPISDYLLHSLFLRLTGAQEQKLKCICWEMACRDYEYRYERYERKPYGECSCYDDKCMVYNDLLNEIKKLDETFDVTDAIRDEILNDWKTSLQCILENSLLVRNFKRSYDEYKVLVASVRKNWIMNKKQLFTKKDNIPESERHSTCGLALNELFIDYVYKERNRSAHNTRSYQHNLPSIREMISKGYKLQNYFLYISIIILLDKIYIKLFNIYLSKMR